MTYSYPKAEEVGIKIPAHLRKERFNEGFQHCLKGGQLREAEHFRLSFREGYRVGKLYLREMRRAQGIATFPVSGRMKCKVAA